MTHAHSTEFLPRISTFWEALHNIRYSQYHFQWEGSTWKRHKIQKPFQHCAKGTFKLKCLNGNKIHQLGFYLTYCCNENFLYMSPPMKCWNDYWRQKKCHLYERIVHQKTPSSTLIITHYISTTQHWGFLLGMRHG